MGAKLDRRSFLKIVGTTAALATTTASGSLRLLKPQEDVRAQAAAKQVPSICMMCPASCQILVDVRDGVVRRVEGNPKGPTSLGKLCARGQAGVFRLYNPDRLKKPLVRADAAKKGTWEGFREASWDEALTEVANHLKKLVEEKRIKELAILYGWPTKLNYEAFVKAFASTLGTPNTMDIPTSMCFFPKALGWSSAMGAGAHTQILTDYENVKYLIVIWRNFFGSISIVHATRAGRKIGNYKLVVLDPRFSETAAKADEWIPIKPGTDLAFLLALINVVISERLYDEAFLRAFTNAPMLVGEDGKPLTVGVEGGKTRYLVWDLAKGKAVKHEEALLPALEGEYEVEGKKAKPVFQLLKEKVANYTPEWAEKITGVPADTIRRIGIEFGKTRPAAVDCGWHGPKYKNATMTFRAAAILNALVGGLIKDGVLLTGVGATATPPPDVPEDNVARVWAARQKIGLAAKGFTFQYLPYVIKNKDPYPISSLFLLSANVLATAPDTAEWINALKALEKVFVVDIYPMDHVAYADVVLPESVYLEKDDPLFPLTYAPAAGFQTRIQAVKPVFDTKHQIEILVEILKRMGDEYYTKYFNALAGALGLDAGKLRQAYESEGVAGIRRLQVEARKLSLEQLLSDGFIVTKPPATLRNELVNNVLAGKHITPTGRIELFSFSLYGIVQRLGPSPYWDPIVDWAPPEVLDKADGVNTFYLTYGRIPTMTQTSTCDEPFLVKLTPDCHRMVWINTKAAERLGVRNGDKVRIVSLATNQSVEAVAYVTELIREDSIWFSSDFAYQGQKLSFFKPGVPLHVLVGIMADPVSGGTMSQEVVVRVEKVG
ncbi:MAG: molybdopterin-dependent oxidoreductase [Thermofilum sp.]